MHETPAVTTALVHQRSPTCQSCQKHNTQFSLSRPQRNLIFLNHLTRSHSKKVKLSCTTCKSEDKSICRIQIWKEIITHGEHNFLKIHLIFPFLQSKVMKAAEILPCYHQTVSGVCVKSCSARGRHWQHSKLRAPGTSPWLMLLGQTHIPLLCHSLRAATGTRDQYWLQCHFPCRLKSFTLRICERGQRNAFLLVQVSGGIWWHLVTKNNMHISLLFISSEPCAGT